MKNVIEDKEIYDIIIKNLKTRDIWYTTVLGTQNYLAKIEIKLSCKKIRHILTKYCVCYGKESITVFINNNYNSAETKTIYFYKML